MKNEKTFNVFSRIALQLLLSLTLVVLFSTTTVFAAYATLTETYPGSGSVSNPGTIHIDSCDEVDLSMTIPDEQDVTITITHNDAPTGGDIYVEVYGDESFGTYDDPDDEFAN